MRTILKVHHGLILKIYVLGRAILLISNYSHFCTLWSICFTSSFSSWNNVYSQVSCILQTKFRCIYLWCVICIIAFLVFHETVFKLWSRYKYKLSVLVSLSSSCNVCEVFSFSYVFSLTLISKPGKSSNHNNNAKTHS